MRLSKAPVTLFLSHAKRDGEELVKEIRRYIDEHLTLNTFFDKTSIGAGSDFASELIGNVDGAAVLVVLTDFYASRPWCQREVLRAKQLGRPVLVVDALKLGEARSFPYLGNTPTVRWQDGPAGFDTAIGYLLREVLRTEYFKRYVESLKTLAGIDPTAHALPYPPELVTAVERRKNGPHAPLYVYPDPPVSAAEAELLASMDPTQRWSTPTLLLCDPQASGERDTSAEHARWSVDFRKPRSRRAGIRPTAPERRLRGDRAAPARCGSDARHGARSAPGRFRRGAHPTGTGLLLRLREEDGADPQLSGLVGATHAQR